MAEEAQSKLKADISDLTEKKKRLIEDLLGIAVMSPPELAEQAELGEAVSAKIIAGAKKSS